MVSFHKSVGSCAFAVISTTYPNRQSIPSLPMAKTKIPEVTPSQAWDSDRYQNQHSFVYKYGSSLVDLLNPQPHETILDLGCGTGELAQEILSKGCAKVIGIDSSKDMIQRASLQFPTIDFYVGDARSIVLPKRDEEEEPQLVDAVFSNAALHWVTDAEACVQSMASVLKPAGRLVIEMGGKHNLGSLASFLDQVCPGKNPWYFPSLSEYASLLESKGFEVLQAHLFDRPTRLEGDEGLRNWILMFGGTYLEGLENPDELLDQAEKELRRELFRGDHWVANYRRLRVVAHKK